MFLKILTAGLLILFSSCSKKTSAVGMNSGGSPSISITDVTQARTKTNSVFRFYVNLSASAGKQTSVKYTTVEGTALAGRDFIGSTGTVSIDQGSNQTYIDITVVGDSLRQNDQQFYVQLSDPVNATMGNAKATGTIGNTEGPWLPVDDAGYTTPASYTGYTLAWADEFNGATMDTQSWNFESGGNGWGNNELENYTSRNQN